MRETVTRRSESHQFWMSPFSDHGKWVSNISKTSARVSSGFQTRETFETTRPQAEWFYCFRAFGNLMKPEAHEFLKLLLQQSKLVSKVIIWISFFNSTIIFETWIVHDPQKMCMMCTILSPNCCAVTVFEYSSADVTLLPSCLSVLSEHVASQSK